MGTNHLRILVLNAFSPPSPVARLEQQIRRQIRASYRGHAAEEWLRACLWCLRNMAIFRRS